MKWEMVKLGEICEINMGKTPSRSNSKYCGGQNPWVAISDLKGDYFISTTKEGITDLATKESGIKPVKKGTLLYSFKLSIGKVAITDKELYTNEAIVALPVIDSSRVDLKYLYHAIQQVNLDGIGDKAVKGLTLNKEKLKELPIPLPPLATQRRIAEILDKADALRQKDQALLRKYDELAQAVFVDMFGDPVRNEKGWPEFRFDKVFDTRLGKMLDNKKQTGLNKYKYLGNSNVLWGKFNLENLQEMDFDEKDRTTFKLMKGDLLICEGGEVGRTAIWQGDFEGVFFQKAIHRARPKEQNVTPEYMMNLMWFLAKFGGLDDYVTSATIAHLTSEKLKTIMLPMPPFSLQQKFADCFNNINLLKEKLNQNHSNFLFQSLLQKAFTGELVE